MIAPGEAGRAARAFEPVAVVGMACRLPGGADSPEALLALLGEGRDLTGPVPADRFAAPASRTWRGGVLAGDPAAFDAGRFGLPDDAATAMDPQIRLLLEVAAEALEDAGVDAAAAGPRGGVYVGLAFTEWRERLARRPDPLLPWFLCETNSCSAAGRLSHHFGFEGPSLTLNAACSSSALGLHLACRDLGAGDVDVALVGGANLFLAAATFEGFDALGVLAPDGRCKTFAATADGYGRAEGVAVVCLKRLADAIAEADRVLAVIEGSAVNNDGAGARYTAPSRAAQVRATQAALASAGLSADDIDVVEAHGTGTRLGDRVEVAALGEAFAARTRPEPVIVGALKANMGHAEAAAGAASLVKTVAAIGAGVVPPHIACAAPSPELGMPGVLRLAPRGTPWPAAEGRRRRAGINSFGMSGVNVHLVVGEPPAAAANLSARGVLGNGAARPPVLAISAQSPQALARLGRLWLDRLAGADAAEIAALAAASVHRRTALPYRIAVAGHTAAELRGALALRLLALEDADAPPPPRRTPDALLHLPLRSVTAEALDLAAADPLVGEALAPLAAAAGEADDRVRALLLSLAVSTALTLSGVLPAAVGGEGAGALAASVLAGDLAFADAVRLARAGDEAPGEADEERLAAAADERRETILVSVAAAPFGARSVAGGRRVLAVPALGEASDTLTAFLAGRLALHEHGLTAPASLLAPAASPWRALPRTPLERRRFWVDDVAPPVRGPAAAPVAATPPPSAAVPATAGATTLDAVADAVGRVLGTAGGALDPDVPLAALGLDSLGATVLAAALSTPATPLTPVTFFSHPTIRAVAAHLAGSPAPVPPAVAAPAASARPVAAAGSADAALSAAEAELDAALARLG